MSSLHPISTSLVLGVHYRGTRRGEMGSIHERIEIGNLMIWVRKVPVRLNLILLIRLTLIETGIAIYLFIA